MVGTARLDDAMTHRIALAGFGNVGQAVVSLMADGHSAVQGLDLALVGVCDPRFGTVVAPEGIDPSRLLAEAGNKSFAALDGYSPDADVFDTIERCQADTLLELTFTDLETGEPATSHIRQALSAGMNVSTTNKGPIALHLDELVKLAREQGAILAYEGTVMSGSPALLTAETVRAAGFRGAVGILNGTTNYVITRMTDGCSYADALAEAQANGFAEADPTGDVDGHDSAGKVAILASVLAEVSLSMDDIERVPLSSLSADDIQAAAADGGCWRYVSVLESDESVWRGTVAPRKLDGSHPLAAIKGATNAITYQTDLLGDVTMVGPGAGRAATAFAVLSDLRQIQGRRR